MLIPLYRPKRIRNNFMHNEVNRNKQQNYYQCNQIEKKNIKSKIIDLNLKKEF